MSQSLHTLAFGVQVLFPDALGKDIKWLKASSLSTVVYIWSMGSVSTTEAFCSWLDVAEMSAATFKEG